MNLEFLDYVEDILDAMDKADAMLSSADYETFEEDCQLIFAVVRALEIVGEAKSRLPEIRPKIQEILLDYGDS